jgi:ABC-type methionine transport system permease subunit
MDKEIPSKISCAPNDFERLFAVINDIVQSIPFSILLIILIAIDPLGESFLSIRTCAW